MQEDHYSLYNELEEGFDIEIDGEETQKAITIKIENVLSLPERTRY